MAWKVEPRMWNRGTAPRATRTRVRILKYYIMANYERFLTFVLFHLIRIIPTCVLKSAIEKLVFKQ